MLPKNFINFKTWQLMLNENYKDETWQLIIWPDKYHDSFLGSRNIIMAYFHGTPFSIKSQPHNRNCTNSKKWTGVIMPLGLLLTMNKPFIYVLFRAPKSIKVRFKYKNKRNIAPPFSKVASRPSRTPVGMWT